MQCRQAVFARDQYNQAMAAQDVVASWTAVQSLLTTAGIVSKLLWGSSGTAEQEERRKPLRELAQVPDDSPLKPRKVRNSFEHIDERIEEWHASAEHMIFSSRCIGVSMAASMMINGVQHKPQHFGFLDPSTGLVTFWHHSISIPEIMEAMEDILLALPDPFRAE